MSTTAAIALSSVALIQTSTAAHTAKVAVCQALVQGYNATQASISQAREYANCISVLYPPDPSMLEVWALKVWVALLLLSMPIGAIVGASGHTYNKTENAILGAIVGVILVAVVGLVLLLSAAGIQYLFS